MSATVGSQVSAGRLSAGQLRTRWRHMLEDPLVAAIPYKVELNEKGAIEVSPATTPKAPDLCVEVLSPSNTAAEIAEKVAAYLAAGAREVWLVSEDGSLEMIDARSRRAESAFGIALVPPKL